MYPVYPVYPEHPGSSDAGAVTVTRQVAACSAAFTVITALPAPTAFTVPSTVTVATPSSLLEKVTLSAPVADSTTLLPTASSTLLWLRVRVCVSGWGSTFFFPPKMSFSWLPKMV